MKKTLALLLALCLMLGMLPALADDSLEGTYVLDASPLGMPLNVYLTIDKDNNFTWSNKLEGGADKGNGMIGSDNGTYMMLYSDSTADQMKTATFTVEGQNLVFSTRIPYGAAGISPKTDDEIILPVAKKLIYQEVLGTYVGSLSAEAPMGTIVYSLELELSLGAEYTLTSTYVVMGTKQEFVQKGSFALDNGKLTLHAEGLSGQEGVLADGMIDLSAVLSAQSSEAKAVKLQKATTAEAAGVYAGVKDMSMMGFVAQAQMTLDAVGGYTYTATTGEGADYTESGAFTVADGKVSLLSAAEGAQAVEGALANDVLTLKMRISKDVPMATEITFYSDRVQGVFTAEGEDAAGAAVQSTLTLNSDGTYAISVNDGAYTEEGTFSVSASPLGTAITLLSTAGVESAGVVADTINLTHNVDEAFNTLGFTYKK